MSNNLNLVQVVASQNQKEVTINDQSAELDAAITVKADFAITDTNIRTLTATEFTRNFLFHVTVGATAPTAAITLTVPAISRGSFAVLNTTAQDVTVTIASQPVTAPVIVSGSNTPSLLTCDGVNVRLASSAGSGGSGDVVGPVSAVAGNIVLFDGITGKLIKDSLRQVSSKVTLNSTLNVVGSLATVGFDLTSFVNRGVIRKITITETAGNSTGTYDVRFYAKDTKLAADLLYSVNAIDSVANSRTFTDQLLVGYEDEDSSSELHLQIDNNDGAQSMTFTVNIIVEKFA